MAPALDEEDVRVLRPDGRGFTVGEGGDRPTRDCGAEVVTRQYDGLFLLLEATGSSGG